MHELAICGSIVNIVARHAPERRVRTIHLRIGQLRQVVPETLVYCWSMVSADTELDGSALQVESVPALISCATCGRTSEVGDYPLFVCSGCDGVDVSVLAGEEFLITALDLVEA
jgi:hydrogenase nickel incorporation protein HypA/HybF